MKKIIFFDLDGTISDSGTGIINAITYAQNKLKLRELTHEEKRSCIGPPLAASFMKLWSLTFEEAEHAVDVYREYYTVTGIYENYLYPDIKELLAHLAADGWQIRICSAKPQIMVETVLRHFEIFNYFSALVGAELHGKYPGKASLIAEALKKEQPDIAVMVGDRKDDIEGAKANGITSVGVLWGYGSLKELTDAGATYTVSNALDIQSICSALSN